MLSLPPTRLFQDRRQYLFCMGSNGYKHTHLGSESLFQELMFFPFSKCLAKPKVWAWPTVSIGEATLLSTVGTAKLGS